MTMVLTATMKPGAPTRKADGEARPQTEDRQADAVDAVPPVAAPGPDAPTATTTGG
jgi:hypothetical protein